MEPKIINAPGVSAIMTVGGNPYDERAFYQWLFGRFASNKNKKMEAMFRDRQKIGKSIFPKATDGYAVASARDVIILCNGNGVINNATIDERLHLFNEVNAVLSKNKVFIYFIRGTFDDPKYFNGNPINLSNIKTVPDYAIIKSRNINVLCVGGGVSVNRTWKKKNNFSNGVDVYVINEESVFDAEAMDKINEQNIKVDLVVSFDSPSFVSTWLPHDNKSWYKVDKDLKTDVLKNKAAIDKVYSSLIEHDNVPEMWLTHNAKNECVANIWFKALSVNSSVMHYEIMLCRKSGNDFEIIKNEIPHNLGTLKYSVTYEDSPIAPMDEMMGIEDVEDGEDDMDNLFDDEAVGNIADANVNNEANVRIGDAINWVDYIH